MTQAFNLSQFANNVNSAGVAQTGGGGTGTNIASNDLTVNGLTVGKGGGAVSSNTAFGTNALTNSTGSSYGVTGFGYYSLAANTSGNSIVGIGANALTSNTTGSASVAIGHEALKFNTTAYSNTAVGYQAGYTNITGARNVFIGYQAGYTSNYNGNAYNTATGYQAGYSLTTGDENTFYGDEAGYGTTTGRFNCFVGAASGSAVTTGSKNSILGSYNGNQNGLDIRTASNYIVLSDGDGSWKAYSNATNWYQNNNSSAWSVSSDERIKKNIAPLENGLSTILALQPKEFDYIVSDKHDVGFIAQEYEIVLPLQMTEQDASGQYAELTNGDKVKGIQQNLVPYLVKAIQELKAEVDSLKQQLGK